MKNRPRHGCCDSASQTTRFHSIRSAVLGSCVLLGLLVWSAILAAAGQSTDTVIVEKLINFPKPLPCHLTCFSNTNQLFVYHLFQKPNLVYHWSLSEKKVLKTYDIGAGYICDGITIRGDGRFTLIACSAKDFTEKVLLIDNQRKTLVRTIPIPGDMPVVSAMEFSTNGQAFRLTINFQKTTFYDTTGAPVSGFDVPESGKTTNQRVWVVENSKGTPRLEWESIAVTKRDGNTGCTTKDQTATSSSRATIDTWLWAQGESC